MSDAVTNKDLYEAIAELRREFTRSIQRLEDGVLADQTARISGLESRVNAIEASVQVDKVKLAALVSGIVFIINALIVVALRVIWPANK